MIWCAHMHNQGGEVHTNYTPSYTVPYHIIPYPYRLCTVISHCSACIIITGMGVCSRIVVTARAGVCVAASLLAGGMLGPVIESAGALRRVVAHRGVCGCIVKSMGAWGRVVVNNMGRVCCVVVVK